MKKFFLIICNAFFLFIAASCNAGEKNEKPLNHNEKSNQSMATPLIVFLVSVDTLNYEAHKTIPVFAKSLEERMNCKTSVLIGSGTHGAYTFPDFEIIDKADLVVVFARRLALPHEQMKRLKKYLSSGKPLVGVRTANHAFTMMGEEAKEGFEYWPEFVSTILGCQNRGYGPVDPGVEISIEPGAENNPVLNGLPKQWHSKANVYKVAPLLEDNITVLLKGKVENLNEPVAWIRKAGSSKIFYTSLGHPTDFETKNFNTLLLNGIKWALEK